MKWRVHVPCGYLSVPSPPLLSLSDLSLFFLSPASSPRSPYPSSPSFLPSSLSLASSSSPRSPYPSSLLSFTPLWPPPSHSAFARYPNGTIEHYYCAKENLAPSSAPSTAPHHTPRTRPLTHTGPHTLIHLAGSHDPIKPPRSCGD